jgi:predicted nucleic acid-binding protein
VVVGLDTSVVVRLLTGQPATLARIAGERLKHLHAKGETIVVTDLVVAEAYYALTHHYGVPKTEARALLHRFGDSGVVTLEPVGALPALLQSSGAGLVDRLIHARHRALGGTTLTFERRQAKLEGAELLRSK